METPSISSISPLLAILPRKTATYPPILNVLMRDQQLSDPAPKEARRGSGALQRSDFLVPRGLVAVKGDIGIEVVVRLGGSRAADTAAEMRVARVVLANIHG
jgi:hypothetical protein